VKYNLAVRQRHAAILGVCALIDSYPYTVEKFMPELLTNVLAEHTYDPVRLLNDPPSAVSWSLKAGQVPISTTVRKCASNFKKTHQDTWHEDSKRFTEEQLSALSTLLTGSSYCEDIFGVFFWEPTITDHGHQTPNEASWLLPYSAFSNSLHVVVTLYATITD
jgi:hypothetical protein